MAATVLEQYTWRPTLRRSSTGAAIAGIDVHVWDGSVSPVKVVNGLTTDANGQIAEQTLQKASHSVAAAVTTTTTTTPHKARFVKFGEIAVEFGQNIQAATEPTFYTDTQTNLTETNKATVLGWTGITVNHPPTESVLLTSSWSMTQLYDRLQAEAEDSPQYDFLEIMSTVDKSNFLMYYSLEIQGASVVFSGLNSTIALQADTDVILSTGAVAQNLRIVPDTGRLVMATVVNLTNVDCTGVMEFTVAGTYDLTDCQIDEVTNTSGGSVTINLLGTSSITTNTGPNITINQSVPLKIKVIDKDTGLPLADARVRCLKDSDKSVLLSGDCDASGEISGSYSGTTPTDAVGWAREMSLTGTDYHQEDFTAVVKPSSGLDLVVALRPISV